MEAAPRAAPGSARTSTKTSDRVFLDTNVLVYSLDVNEPRKREIARRLLEDPGGATYVISTQVLQELFWALTRRLRVRYSPEQGELATHSFLPLAKVEGSNVLVMDAIAANRRWQIAFWDALIVQAALSSGCRRLLTEDLQHGRTYDGLLVENPFLTPE